MAQARPPSNRAPRASGGRSNGARKTPSPTSDFSLTPAQQEQLAALALFVIALLTALGAFNLSGGNILDGWTRVLSILFGWGRILAPLFFGGLGLWLLLDSLDMRPDIGWERPFALILLFIVIESGLQIIAAGTDSFAAAQRGEGGGLVGHAFYDLLVGGLGWAGAILVLVVLAFSGVTLLFNIPLSQLINRAAGLARAAQQRLGLRNGRGATCGRSRTPLEMMTAPPRDRSESRPSTRNGTPALPADFLDVPHSTSSASIPSLRPPLAAHIVGESTMPREWRLPDIREILEESAEQDASPQEIRARVKKIEETLLHFGVPAKVVEVNQGPTITQFGVEPGFIEQKGPDGTTRRVKIKVNRISALQHDLELALAAAPIRVEAPVPGKSIVGIEVPNTQISRVSLRGVMESEEFQRLRAQSALAIALGQDVSGQPIVADLGKMPHLLIAGATGSGKSVCINSLIACLLMTNTPDDVKFVMLDPKRVELSLFNGIPHLLTPVVVETDLAVAALQRTVQEMDERYRRFQHAGVRNIEGFNALPEERRRSPKMPYLILVVDELADLMITAATQVEHAITRLAQMARATGIHLVLATQRPSVDVVTGLIKANFPSRISFAVTSQVDSRVVLDAPGAEKLLGRGDMLYMASDSSKLLRLQGCFVSDRELDRLVTYWKGFIPETAATGGTMPSPSTVPQARVSPSAVITPPSEDWVQGGLWSDLAAAAPKAKSAEDDLLDQAIEIVRTSERASISLLQRKLRIGYSRAARLMELLEQKGYVGEDEGPTKGREVLRKLPHPPSSSQPAADTAKSPPPTRAGASDERAARAEPSDAPPEREFEGLDGFDDWTEEDWADLDKD